MPEPLDDGFAVEITYPKGGSAHLIGGRLVLTCAHVVGEVGTLCKVRSNKAFGTVDGKVVWVHAEADLALIELPDDSIKVRPAKFGKFPAWHQSHQGIRVPCSFFGYPSWFISKDQDSSKFYGGLPIDGTIPIGAEVKNDRFSLEAKQYPPVGTYDASDSAPSPWQGASGSAVLCDGLVVAVLRQHTDLKNPERLTAQPLQVVYDDREWQRLLTENGIDFEFQEISLKNQSIQKGRKQKVPIGASNAVIPMAKLRSPMVELLHDLNCREQKYQFENKLELSAKAAAFVIQAPCRPTRKWLLHRLSRMIPNYETAIHCTMSPTAYSTEANFWGHLASELSQKANANISSDPDSVLHYLGGGDLLKPIIISIHDLEQETQGFENLILKEFWEPLNERLTSPQSERKRTSRIVLFLTKKTHAKSDCDGLEPPLDDLSYLSQENVDEWVAKLSGSKRQTVFQKQLIEKLKSLPSLEFSEPGRVINQLCDHVGFQKGIADLESLWGKAS